MQFYGSRQGTKKADIVIVEPKISGRYTASHMDICKKILEKSVPQAKIFCLEIPIEVDGKSNVEMLSHALYECININPTVVSLSIGSIRPSDAYILEVPIGQLIKHNVFIVAAMSNIGYLTVPASLENVFGVIADDVAPCDNPRVYRVQLNDYGVDLVAGYKDISCYGIEFSEQMVGNSFVVPVVAAELYKLKNICSVNKKKLCLYFRKKRWNGLEK